MSERVGSDVCIGEECCITYCDDLWPNVSVGEPALRNLCHSWESSGDTPWYGWQCFTVEFYNCAFVSYHIRRIRQANLFLKLI